MENDLKKGDPVTIEHLDLKGFVSQDVSEDDEFVDIQYLDGSHRLNHGQVPISAVNRNKDIAEDMADKIRAVMSQETSEMGRTHTPSTVRVEDLAKMLNEYIPKEKQIEVGNTYGY